MCCFPLHLQLSGEIRQVQHCHNHSIALLLLQAYAAKQEGPEVTQTQAYKPKESHKKFGAIELVQKLFDVKFLHRMSYAKKELIILRNQTASINGGSCRKRNHLKTSPLSLLSTTMLISATTKTQCRIHTVLREQLISEHRSHTKSIYWVCSRLQAEVLIHNASGKESLF